MPLVSIIPHVRGWGETSQEADNNALDRLERYLTKARAGQRHIEQGLAVLHEDPGNGGPCGPAGVRTQNFEYLIATEDLPEFYDRKPRDD